MINPYSGFKYHQPGFSVFPHVNSLLERSTPSAKSEGQPQDQMSFQFESSKTLVSQGLQARLHRAASDVKVDVTQARESQGKIGLEVSGECLTGIPGAVLKLSRGENGAEASITKPGGEAENLPTKRNGEYEGAGYIVGLPDGTSLSIGGQNSRLDLNRNDQLGNSVSVGMKESGTGLSLSRISASTEGYGNIVSLQEFGPTPGLNLTVHSNEFLPGMSQINRSAGEHQVNPSSYQSVEMTPRMDYTSPPGLGLRAETQFGAYFESAQASAAHLARAADNVQQENHLLP